MRPSFVIGSASLRAGNGGIARVGRLTARALIDAGVNVRLLSFGDCDPLEVEAQPVKISHESKLRFVLNCQMAGLSSTHFLYDHAGIARAHVFPLAPGRPYAVWLHCNEAPLPRIGAALRRADLVLVNSSYTLARFERLHGPLPQARVCWLSTAEDESPTETASFNGPPTALILARMEKGERKGHAELIECWPSVVARVPSAQLLVVGGGSAVKDFKELAAASPVAAHIAFTDFVPESEIDNVWSRAHLLVMASRQEGFGLVYIEAMRRGLPVIASRQDAGQEINVDGKTGFNVDLDQPGDLALRLTQLLGNPTLCARMGMAGQRKWAEHFRYSSFRSRVLEHLSAFSGVRLARSP